MKIEKELVCKSCGLIYMVYGSRKRCDLCNTELSLAVGDELKMIDNEEEK